MKLSELFEDSSGKKVLLSGNEALSRGIFEAGVCFAANYPGTPLSEIGDNLKYISDNSNDFTFNYSINEKVALESCIGASWAGVRSVVMFKHLGMNVAADPLHTFPYSGTIGGMLILYGDDPGILSSTNAQDNRLYSLHTKIPIIEPSTVQECKKYIIKGLKFSEIYNVPICIHLTTRLSHSYGLVVYGKINKTKKKGYFKKDAERYINTLNRALKNQENYFRKISKISVDSALSQVFNKIKIPHKKIKNGLHNKNIGIITSGICYSYVIQACNKLNIYPPILKLGLVFPINKETIYHFINKFNLKTLLIVEELEPFIETLIRQIVYYEYDKKIELDIHGKEFLPKIGELDTEQIIRFFFKYFRSQNKTILDDLNKKESVLKEIIPKLPLREPTFCPGCQYRPVFYSLKRSIERINKESGVEFIYSGDISCATLSEAYPYQMLDWVVCMGAGVGIANGMIQVIDPTKQKIVAFIGDSTFFHCGIQPIIDAIKSNLDYTIVIFNNYWTAMTGHQAHVGTPRNILEDPNENYTSIEINLENILKALNVENLIITKAYNIEKLERIFYENLQKKGLKVIVINEECALKKKKRLVDQNKTEIYYTISESCVKCNECIEFFGCPAIEAIDKDGEIKYRIDESLCTPYICPGVCKQICFNNMIRKTEIFKE
ncbi:MAG: indolepyruvate ferredoxin oxidoreductase subunit alpha [Candidatus Lokiarchaeota archaeon]|nr:indolepyruvate ferredoxin oxidoreductase subunit alpha [Candidatus Lokiarchaeota archaeon]